jgi:lipoprotein NlpI
VGRLAAWSCRTAAIGGAALAAVFAAALAGGAAIAQEDPLDVLTATIERGGMAPADMAALYNGRGDAFVGRGMLDSAVADFTQAIALRPDYTDAYINRAGVHFAQARFDPALADYTAALQIERTEASAYIGRGQVYYYLKRYPASIADLKLAARYSPASRHAVLWLYLAEWRAGQTPGAALAANPVRWSPNEWPGPLMALFLGSITPAVVLEAARNNDPVIQRAQECEALFYGGGYLLTRGKASEAKELLRRSLDACLPSRPLHAAARLELGGASGGGR